MANRLAIKEAPVNRLALKEEPAIEEHSEEEPALFGRRIPIARELEPLMSGVMKLEDYLPLEDRFQFGEIVGVVDKPEQEEERLKNVLYYSVAFNQDPKTTNMLLDELISQTGFEPTKATPEERGFFGKIAESWRRGQADINADLMVFQAAFENKGDLQQALNIQKKIGLKEALDPIEGNFFAELVYGSARILPGMIGGYWSAIDEAFIGMGMGAGLALAAGQVPPLIVMPEEIGTVPAGALIGGKIGLMLGSATYWYKQGAGSMLTEMLEEGYDLEVSKNVASVAAIPYAIIEFLQVSQLTPGLRSTILQTSKDSLKRVVLNAVKKYGKIWGQEIFEEVVQEGIQIGTKDISGILSGKGVTVEESYIADRSRRVWETLKDAAKSMALLPIPGATIDVYTGARAVAEVVEKPPVEPEVAPEAPPTVAVKPPAKIAEKPPEVAPKPITPAEPTADGKAELSSLFSTQDKTVEHKFPIKDGNASFFEEAAGDIFREMTKDTPDGAYIAEKIHKLKQFSKMNKATVDQTVEAKERLKEGQLEVYEKALSNLKAQLNASEVGNRQPVMQQAIKTIESIVEWFKDPRTAVFKSFTNVEKEITKLEKAINQFQAKPAPEVEVTQQQQVNTQLETAKGKTELFKNKKGDILITEEYPTGLSRVVIDKQANITLLGAGPVDTKIWKPIAKPVKFPTPKGILGGVERPPKGLTRAEVGHLGRREQDALRAAQAKGLKVGYKQGVAETVLDARRSLDAFRMKEKISEKMRMDAASVVLTYVPKEKQGDYIRRILQARTQTRIERLTEAIDKYLDKAEKRQSIRDFKGFVKGIKKRYRRGEVALGKLPKKLADKIVEALSEFDLAKISEKKTETLERRAKFVTRISNELANGFEAMNEGMDKDAVDLLMMGTRRIDELKRLSQTHIGELDTDQIKYIQSSLEHLIKINDLKGRAKERTRMEKLRTDINTARQEIRPPKERVVELTGLLGAMRWIGVEGQSTIRTLVGLSTGKENAANKKLLVDELDGGNNDRKGTYKDFIMHFRKLAERAGLEWNDLKNLPKTTKVTIGGKEIDIDYDNLLLIYGHTEAEGNLRRLLKTKGLNITVYSRDEHGILNKKHIHRVGRPTLEELRAIRKVVPDAHKKLLNVHFNTNWEKQAPAINETSMKMQNYELARQKKYLHLNREIERVIEGKKADISVSIEQQGRYLPRTGGNARINIRPFTLEVIRGMQADAAYHDMAIPMENARTLVANSKWREAMKRAGQQRALTEITRMLRRTQGLISDQSIIELTASRLLGTVGKSILSVRLSGSFVQTASVPAAVEFIDAEHLAQVDIPTPADIKHLKDIDPVLWMRWEGKQFDYALGMVGSQNAFETLLFGHRPVTEKFLFPYTAGDEVAITKLFMAAERQVEATTDLKRGTSEFQKASLDLLHEALVTQPQWDMINRSPLMSDPSVLARSVTVFMSARNAQYNVLVRAVDDYRKGRIGRGAFSKRVAGVGTANMLVSLSRHLFKALALAGAIVFFTAMGLREPPDEEELKKEALRIAKKVPLETAFNLIGLNAIGTLFVSMGYAALKTRKYGWQKGRYSDIRTGNMLADITLDVMQTGIDFTLFTDQLISGEKYKSGKNRGRYKWEITGMRLIDDISMLIAYRYGLPYEGLRSDIVWPAERALKGVSEKPIVKIER